MSIRVLSRVRPAPLACKPHASSSPFTVSFLTGTQSRNSVDKLVRSNTFRRKMSYSNTSTGDKPADPYVQKNLDQTSTKEKVSDLITFVEKCKFCMMTTKTPNEGLLVGRAMALAGKEGNGIDLIFHANTESGKTDDLKADPSVCLAFLDSKGEWASISGEASVETDRDIVKRHYSPALKAWVGDLGDGVHDGGPDDPRICVIKIKAITAQYAVSNRTTIGSFVEIAKGAVSGEAAQVNKLRRIEQAELQQWRASGTS